MNDNSTHVGTWHTQGCWSCSPDCFCTRQSLVEEVEGTSTELVAVASWPILLGETCMERHLFGSLPGGVEARSVKRCSMRCLLPVSKFKRKLTMKLQREGWNLWTIIWEQGFVSDDGDDYKKCDIILVSRWRTFYQSCRCWSLQREAQTSMPVTCCCCGCPSLCTCHSTCWALMQS